MDQRFFEVTREQWIEVRAATEWEAMALAREAFTTHEAIDNAIGSTTKPETVDLRLDLDRRLRLD